MFPAAKNHLMLGPQFPHLEKGRRLEVSEGISCSKVLIILWGLSFTQPPGQPCWAFYSPPWLGARAQGEVISWWELRGWSRRRHELVLPASNVTPQANTAASRLTAWLLSKRTAQPMHCWAGAEES